MTLPVSYLAGLVILRLYDKPIMAYAIIGFLIVCSTHYYLTHTWCKKVNFSLSEQGKCSPFIVTILTHFFVLQL